MKYLLGILIMFSLCMSISAQNKVWNGGGTTNKWSDPDNWFPIGVPIPLEYVGINGHNVNMDTNVTIRNLKLVNATLNIPKNKSLNIEAGFIFPNTEGVFLDSGACIQNNGDLLITESTLVGLKLDNGSCIENGTNANLEVYDVGDPRNNGIVLFGKAEFYNDSLAYLSVRNNLYGIRIYSGTFVNRRSGNIYLESNGMHNSDQIINRGEITLNNGTLYNFDSIYNSQDGAIYIENRGFEQFGCCSNQGSINIDGQGTGLKMGGGHLENNGTINMIGAISYGLDIRVSKLDNYFGGQIIVKNVTDPNSSAIYMYGSQLINEGKIIIENCQGDGIVTTQSSSIVSLDTIFLQGIDSIGIHMFPENYSTTLDTFTIETGGSLSILDCGTPIYIDTLQIFNCQGTMEIEP